MARSQPTPEQFEFHKIVKDIEDYFASAEPDGFLTDQAADAEKSWLGGIKVIAAMARCQTEAEARLAVRNGLASLSGRQVVLAAACLRKGVDYAGGDGSDLIGVDAAIAQGSTRELQDSLAKVANEGNMSEVIALGMLVAKCHFYTALTGN